MTKLYSDAGSEFIQGLASKLPASEAAGLVSVIAQVAEQSFRRGYEHGSNYPDQGLAAELRRRPSLTEAPWPVNGFLITRKDGSTSAVTRLLLETRGQFIPLAQKGELA